jgi:D-alanyl-D-alanine carboxypeptidase
LRITHSIPGLSIAVVKVGIPLLVQGYGLANVELADLVKWEAALCSEQILKRSTLEQMWRSHESKIGNEREKYGFTNGLGWHIPNYSDRKVVSHNGSIKGFATNITRYIDDKVTVMLLCNLENIARPDAIAKSIAEQFIPSLAKIPLQPPL